MMATFLEPGNRTINEHVAIEDATPYRAPPVSGIETPIHHCSTPADPARGRDGGRILQGEDVRGPRKNSPE
jgi:hypothetical protein